MTFQFRASSKNFYKIIKSSNRHFKTDQNSNHYLPRQYFAHGEDVTRNSDGEKQIGFSVTTFGYCNQPQKISPSPCDRNRVFELIDTGKMTLVLSEKKIKHVSQRCQVIFTQPKALVLNLKINWPFVINRLGHFISMNPSFNISNRSKYSLCRKGGPTVAIWHWVI